jgi:hypothetical protein
VQSHHEPEKKESGLGEEKLVPELPMANYWVMWSKLTSLLSLSPHICESEDCSRFSFDLSCLQTLAFYDSYSTKVKKSCWPWYHSNSRIFRWGKLRTQTFFTLLFPLASNLEFALP